MTMTDDFAGAVTLPWHWEWVPAASAGDEVRRLWSDHLVELFEGWTGRGLAAVRAALPERERAGFPLTAELLGRHSAQWLAERADSLIPGQRLAWGAAFVDGRPRWAPVPVAVEFRSPLADDPMYLMEIVGAGPRRDARDEREPVVDYVTTPYGDGLRVLGLGRSDEGLAFGRLDAAMRLDWPATGEREAVRMDVLLTTRVVDMSLLAMIGPGVEQLMQRIANEHEGVRNVRAHEAREGAVT
jgi:hypothetical protein